MRKQSYSVSALNVWSPCNSWLCMAVVSGRCVRIGSEQAVVDFELLLGRFGWSLGLWRSAEDTVVVYGLRGRRNDANS